MGLELYDQVVKVVERGV